MTRGGHTCRNVPSLKHGACLSFLCILATNSGAWWRVRHGVFLSLYSLPGFHLVIGGVFVVAVPSCITTALPWYWWFPRCTVIAVGLQGFPWEMLTPTDVRRDCCGVLDGRSRLCSATRVLLVNVLASKLCVSRSTHNAYSTVFLLSAVQWGFGAWFCVWGPRTLFHPLYGFSHLTW